MRRATETAILQRTNKNAITGIRLHHTIEYNTHHSTDFKYKKYSVTRFYTQILVTLPYLYLKYVK